MARAALPGRLTWQLGRVVELIDETPRVRSIKLELPEWQGHRAGQHVDVRLTAEDGYQAQRSYSIASSPDEPTLMLTIERLDDGEVSPYLAQELRVGDELELRGPIGGYFVWEHAQGGPLLLIAGGSGVVPFRSMLRYWSSNGGGVPIRLIYSARSWGDVIYRDELLGRAAQDMVDIRFTLTREWPAGWTGHRGRIDCALVDEVAWPVQDQPLTYVCGPSGFVEGVAEALVHGGQPADRIRTERFGPTGA
jgi:ferredoxin-NADP reductase